MKEFLLFGLFCVSGARIILVKKCRELASVFGSHMVLQRAPQSAVLWGTATVEGDKVTAYVIAAGTNIAPVTTTVVHGAWKLKLHPVAAAGPYVINVTSSEGHVTLSDVLFGDVWLCSGQSNMYFTMNQVMNFTFEIETAHNFPNIRFTRARIADYPTPRESMVFDIPWTGPDNTRYLQGFSAVCWLFAEYLYPHVSHPIGLIESSYAGTPIEAWSPPEAVHDCASVAKRLPSNNTFLWNAMINPLLGTTLYGALWYLVHISFFEFLKPGENNAAHASNYSCQIQALVSRWRSHFNEGSLGETPVDFPFGYVQLAGYTQSDVVGSFPGERWAQTAGYGYSPNPALPKTFMAVAMDLPDYSSPFGAIQPRYKQDVSERLMLGALNVAYSRNSVVFQGPFPTNFQIDAAQHTLTILYDNGRTPLEVRNNKGFEVCCSPLNVTVCSDARDHWVAAPIIRHDTSHVVVSTSDCGTSKTTGVRYEWRTSPCEYKLCAVYGAASDLPAPTYITYTIPQ